MGIRFRKTKLLVHRIGRGRASGFSKAAISSRSSTAVTFGCSVSNDSGRFDGQSALRPGVGRAFDTLSDESKWIGPIGEPVRLGSVFALYGIVVARY